jgi:uncharacterized protein (UPF0332 family)
MSKEADRLTVARGWWAHAVEALKTAEHDAAMFPSAAVNRAYDACFYAASAVLQYEGRHFVEHTGVRAAVHGDLVKTGRLPRDAGEGFDRPLKARQSADYGAMSRVTPEGARSR